MDQPTTAPLTSSTLAPTALTIAPTATTVTAGPTAAVETSTSTTGLDAGSVRVVTTDSDSSGLVIGIVVLVLLLGATLVGGGCYIHHQRKMALVNEEQLRQFNRRVTAADDAAAPLDSADYGVVAQTRRVAVQNQTYTPVHASSTAQGVTEGVETGARVLKLERDSQVVEQVVEQANAPSGTQGSTDSPTHSPNIMYAGASHENLAQAASMPDPELMMSTLTKRTHHVVCATSNALYTVPMDNSAAPASAPGAATEQGKHKMGGNAGSSPSIGNTYMSLLQAHTPNVGADAADGYVDVWDYSASTASQTSSTT